MQAAMNNLRLFCLCHRSFVGLYYRSVCSHLSPSLPAPAHSVSGRLRRTYSFSSGRTCGCARAAGGTRTCCTTVVAVDDHVGTVLPQINGSGGVEHDDALGSHPNTSVRLFIALASRCGVTSTITLATAWVHASHNDRTFAPMRRRQVLFLDASRPFLGYVKTLSSHRRD